jgi:hypothetical protein
MSFQRATDLRTAYRASDVKPLEGDALDYLETDEVTDKSLFHRFR